MAEFVTCAHPGIEGTARLARTALRHMPGWVPVDADQVDPAGTDVPAPDTTQALAGEWNTLLAGPARAVNGYLDDNPDAAAAVLAAEAAGRNRKTITQGPHAG